MLPTDKTNELVLLNKKQKNLVERFERLAQQLSEAGVSIVVNEEYNEAFYANTRQLQDGLISGLQNIMDNFPDIKEDAITEFTCLTPAYLPLDMIYEKGYYGAIREGTLKRLKKENNYVK